MQFANILNLCVCVCVRGRLCVCVEVCARTCAVSSGAAVTLHRDDLSVLSIFHNVINTTPQTLHFFYDITLDSISVIKKSAVKKATGLKDSNVARADKRTMALYLIESSVTE